MDKYEYKLKLEQLKNLVDAGDYSTAGQIVDSVNWKKVRNSATLCMVADVYDKLGRYEESKDIYLMAYDHAPIGRSIIYKLTEVAIKSNSLAEAEEYYNEYAEIAGNDTQKLALRYQLSTLKGEPVQNRISILEELKEREYTEEWAYELARLYQEAGKTRECVDVCDELDLWFGDGEYVEKALELKMTYEPLSKSQEEKFRKFRQKRDEIIVPVPVAENKRENVADKLTGTVPFSQDPRRFDTMNLQAELQKSLSQLMDAKEQDQVTDTMDSIKKMVEDIPQLKKDMDVNVGMKINEDILNEKIDEAVAEDFQVFLQEAAEAVPETAAEADQEAMLQDQITGQLNIEDVLADWEKTKRAAEAALAVADQKKLEVSKLKAIQEAQELIQKLEALTPELAEGSTPRELLEQEYLTEPEQEVIPEVAPTVPLPDVTAFLQQQESDTMAVPAPGFSVAMSAEESVDETEEDALVQDAMDEAHQSLLAEIERIAKASAGIDEILNGPAAEAAVSMADPVILEPEALFAETSQPEPEAAPVQIPAAAGKVVLTKEQRALFPYFLPVPGMEQQICQVLEECLAKKKTITSLTGNITIEGPDGSGKTVLAASLIKALQMMTATAEGRTGKISANALNKKDLATLIPKLEGGYLIIEKAGNLRPETVERLSRAMEGNTRGLTIIMEDSKSRMRAVLAQNRSFAQKFTSGITIPVFTIDELVEFGKSYAKEMECTIDEMGILALYNRISNIQKHDKATTLTEVREIVDAAIESAEGAGGGLKKSLGSIFSKRYNDNDYLILREKDFDF